MKKWLLILLLSSFAAPTPAQENTWDNLATLRAGQKIEVVDASLRKFQGTFVSHSDEAIVLRSDGNDQAVPRDEVFRVSLREHSKRLRNTLIGLAIGAAAGLAVGAAIDSSFSEDGEHISKTILTPIGAGAGAGLGAAFASYETIYRAPKRPRPPKPATP